jgi:hypothetical protein
MANRLKGQENESLPRVRVLPSLKLKIDKIAKKTGLLQYEVVGNILRAGFKALNS